MKTPVGGGRGLRRGRMIEDVSFTDFPLEIRERVASYVAMTSPAGIPEVSQHGSEGSEYSEGTEGSETSERSEMTETSENSETTEMMERYGAQFPRQH